MTFLAVSRVLGRATYSVRTASLEEWLALASGRYESGTSGWRDGTGLFWLRWTSSLRQ